MINKSFHFVDKTRSNMGRGLLQNLLKKNWELLPSIHATVDRFTQSDAIHVLEERNQATRSKVIDLERRIDYLESKAELLDILPLTKIFSDSKSIRKIRKRDDPNWSKMQERQDLCFEDCNGGKQHVRQQGGL